MLDSCLYGVIFFAWMPTSANWTPRAYTLGLRELFEHHLLNLIVAVYANIAATYEMAHSGSHRKPL